MKMTVVYRSPSYVPCYKKNSYHDIFVKKKSVIFTYSLLQ